MKLTAKKIFLFILASSWLLIASQCNRPKDDGDGNAFKTTPYDFSKDNMSLFPPMPQPQNNLATMEGVKLGRMLFYDPILSGDSSISCASCHKQENGFSSNKVFEDGVGGTIGVRSSMSLNNLAWENIGFFWDGRSKTLEDQAIHPVENPIEMQENWDNVVKKLKRSPLYPQYFKEAFKDGEVSKDNATKAIGQFMRTLISSRSKFDMFSMHKGQLSSSEQRGFVLFTTDPTYDAFTGEMLTTGGDCSHCHNPSMNFQDYTAIGTFRNNGLDSVSDLNQFKDKGRGDFTGKLSDYGMFKVPSLRNVALSEPYMHDGRFNTLLDVVNHYDAGGKPSPNLDQFMARKQFANHGGHLNLSPQDKQDIISFLKTLTDTAFIHDQRYSNPF